jgi:hypothetical protein
VAENQKINRNTLATTPTLFHNPAKFNPKNLTFIPGQPVAVDGRPSDSVAWMTPPAGDGSYEREQSQLKGWGEELISSLDIASPLNAGGGANAETRYQIGAVSSDHINTRQLDLQIFQQAYALIFERVWSLLMQYGPDEFTATVDDTGKIDTIKKEEVYGSYTFTCGGRFGVTSPLLEAQKAQMRLQEFKNDPFVDQYELRRDVIQKMDPRLAKRLMKPRHIVEQEMAQAREQEMMMAMSGAKPKGVASPVKSHKITGEQSSSKQGNDRQLMVGG